MPDKVVKITINEFASEGALKGIQKSMKETLIKVAAQAKSLAPVDLGQLKNSIMWDFNKEEGALNDSGGEKTNAKLTLATGKLVGYVGTNLEYAVYQEFGTRNLIAQPYLRPAGESAKGVTAKAIGEKYGREAMEEEFKRRKVKKIES